MKALEIQYSFRKGPKPKDGSEISFSNEHNSTETNSLQSIKRFFRTSLLKIRKIVMCEYLFSGSFFTGITKCKHKRNVEQ